MIAGSKPNDFRLRRAELQSTRRTPGLEICDTGLSIALGHTHISNCHWSKQLFVVCKQVMALDAKFVKDSGYIFGIRIELYWPQYGTLGYTARDRKDSRLLVVDAEHLSTPVRQERNHFSAGTSTRNCRCRTSSRISWSTVSNAELRSRRTRHVTLPSSGARIASFRMPVRMVLVERKWR